MHIYDLALEMAKREWDAWPVRTLLTLPNLTDCHFFTRKAFIMLDNEKWKMSHFWLSGKRKRGWKVFGGVYGTVLAVIKVYASVSDLIKNKKNENAKLFDCQMRALRISGFARDIYCYFYFKFVYVN